ncbi:peptide MFS transporter [uncultured Methanobrevibacter sp.]|uniref:peptide MFS transporter n=1 Tax=uncultured Methanobrevibacter sp. TaxID=253161 RepID=UPI0025E84E83|nr:peptide MFS transporter [uncultured Methanobrevibacter sp.]
MRHPKGLFVLSSTEMCERFSYYIILSILVLYMIEVLHFSPAFSSLLSGIVTGMIYIAQLLGGYLSDKFLGNRKAIILGGILMAIGQFTFAYSASLYYMASSIPEHSVFLFTFQECIFIGAIFIIALGSGLFKVNISSMVHLLYDDDEEKLLDSAFTIYYMAINIGGLLAPFIVNFVVGAGDPSLYQYGFIIAAIYIVCGVVGFILLKDKYLYSHDGKKIGITPASKDESLTSKVGEKVEKLTKAEVNHVIVILIMCIFSIIFFACNSQITTSVLLFCKTYVSPTIPFTNFNISPEFYIGLNALLFIVVAPFVMKFLDWLETKNKAPSSITKIGLGFLAMAVAFSFLVISAKTYDGSTPIDMSWALAFNVILVLAEVLMTPILLSLVSKLSPERHTSLLIGVWFFTLAIAQILGGIFAGAYPSDPGVVTKFLGLIPVPDLASFMLIYVILPFVCGVIWLLFRNKMMRLTEDVL